VRCRGLQHFVLIRQVRPLQQIGLKAIEFFRRKCLEIVDRHHHIGEHSLHHTDATESIPLGHTFFSARFPSLIMRILQAAEFVAFRLQTHLIVQLFFGLAANHLKHSKSVLMSGMWQKPAQFVGVHLFRVAKEKRVRARSTH
jgi:hypothetical protein